MDTYPEGLQTSDSTRMSQMSHEYMSFFLTVNLAEILDTMSYNLSNFNV